jgi:hypothetical protein
MPRKVSAACFTAFCAASSQLFEALERQKAIGRGKALHPLDEQSIEGAGRIAVEHLADVVVARNRRHAEQGLAVRPAVPLGQCPLVLQERWALH